MNKGKAKEEGSPAQSVLEEMGQVCPGKGKEPMGVQLRKGNVLLLSKLRKWSIKEDEVRVSLETTNPAGRLGTKELKERANKQHGL